MERRRLKVLLVEDDEDDATLLLRELRRAGFELDHARVEDERSMEHALAEDFDLVLSDYSLPRFSAPHALATLRRSAKEIPFIIVSGTVDEQIAVEALRAGAADFVTKGRLTRLVPAIDRELRDAETRRVERAARAELEQQLLHAQKMDAIGRLAGGIAHDFNNLLGVITSYAHFLAEDLAPDDARQEDVAQIRIAAERAAALTQQLLTFGRRQPAQPRVLDLNEVVLGFESMLRRAAGASASIALHLEDDLPRTRADRGQLEQVLMNLVVNARDAMPKGGEIEIASARDGAERVVLSVRDRGVGMSAETVSRIFEPFFTTKPPGHGTGLGLATVYGIVRQSGGECRVESALGAGTTFRIALPVVGPEESARAPSSRPPATGGTESKP